MIWWRNKTKAALHLGVMAVFSGVYAFIFGLLYFTFKTSADIETLLVRATWMGILMLPSFITFLYYFTKKTKYLVRKSFILYSVGIVIVAVSLLTPYVVGPKTDLSVQGPYYWFKGEQARPLTLLWRLYILFCLSVVLINILRYYFGLDSDDDEREAEKKRIKYFVWGTTIYAIAGVVTTSLLPAIFNESLAFVEIPAFLSFIWVALTAYVIIRHRLIGIKVLMLEAITFLIWIFLIIRTILSETKNELCVNFVLLVLVFFLGILLIRSTYKETEATRDLLKKKGKRVRIRKMLARDL